MISTAIKFPALALFALLPLSGITGTCTTGISGSLREALTFLVRETPIHSLGARDEMQWHFWRGPLGNGSAPQATPPTEWSEANNVSWKVEIPGIGHSSPIVSGNQVFITSAIAFGEKFDPIRDDAPGSHDNLAVEQRHRFVALAFDRETGKRLWQTALHEAIPHEGAHYTGSLASHSPLTDGEHLYVSFGSYGVYCLTMQGELVWERQLGRMQSKHGHGEGSSPVLHGGLLIQNWDHEGDSFIVALDKRTGEERWRNERDEVTSWSSPIVVVHEGVAQLIVCGTERVRAYDTENGKELWNCGGLSHNIVATPVHEDGIVVVGSSYEKKAMMAIRLDGASGDITDSKQVIWTRDRGTPYVPSPLIYRGQVYYLSHYQGILSRVELATGDEPLGPFRLDRVRDVYASLAAANNHIYVVDRDGFTTVIEAGEIPRFVSRNRLDDRFSASPAFVGRQLFLRGERFIYCLEESE